jgi:hypothetical protein
MEGKGRRGLAGCGTGLGVPRRQACWPGSAIGEGAGWGRRSWQGGRARSRGRGLESRQEPPKEEKGGEKKGKRKRRKRKRKREKKENRK